MQPAFHCTWRTVTQRCIVSAALWMLAALACAEPNEYVEASGGERGEHQLELRSGTARNRDGTRTSAHTLSLGYGFTERWFSEVLFTVSHEPGQGHELQSVEWENKLRLLAPADAPVGVTALIELERLQARSEGVELRGGPLLEWNVGPWQWNLNPLWTAHLHDDAKRPTELGYQVQLKRAVRSNLALGLQGFGDLGPWDDWLPSRLQSHRFGPAVFGSVKLSHDEAFVYDAALLVLTSGTAPRQTLRVQLEWEF